MTTAGGTCTCRRKPVSDIKSAFEKAMEKAERLGRPSEEDVARWTYQPQGEKLAAAYLRGEADLLAELEKHPKPARQHVVKAAEEILLRNLGIPRNDYARSTNQRVMEALKAFKQDRRALGAVYANMKRIFDHYEQEGAQQRKAAYEQLKRDFEARVRQAVQQQTGRGAGVRIQVETQPQFQEEWRRMQAHLDSQYEKLLEEYREEIARLS